MLCDVIWSRVHHVRIFLGVRSVEREDARQEAGEECLLLLHAGGAGGDAAQERAKDTNEGHARSSRAEVECECYLAMTSGRTVIGKMWTKYSQNYFLLFLIASDMG